MNQRIQNLFKPIVGIAVISFLLLCICLKPEKIGDYTSYVGYSITIATAVFIFYDRLLWQWIPWNRPPVLKGQYKGKIFYNYAGIPEEKEMEIKVTQTWLSISIETKTDINYSISITSDILNEHNSYVLYYTYMTNPSAVDSFKNPIQYGTCRMSLNGSTSKIKGRYWTSSQTAGDIEWNKL